MKLHTDKITRADLYNAARYAGVSLNEVTEQGSRSRAGGFQVYLEGSSNHQSNGRPHKAATWDEWGIFMAYLYEIDPVAMWGNKSWGYSDVEDFNRKTQDRFTKGIPYDLHTQHKWSYDYQRSRGFGGQVYHNCTGCSASTYRD
jgi:hypothetical protein